MLKKQKYVCLNFLLFSTTLAFALMKRASVELEIFGDLTVRFAVAVQVVDLQGCSFPICFRNRFIAFFRVSACTVGWHKGNIFCCRADILQSTLYRCCSWIPVSSKQWLNRSSCTLLKFLAKVTRLQFLVLVLPNGLFLSRSFFVETMCVFCLWYTSHQICLGCGLDGNGESCLTWTFSSAIV